MVLETGLFLTCIDCKRRKPLGGYVAITRRPGHFYSRCRMCRNRRARERYWSNEQIRRAEIDRSWRNKLRRRAANGRVSQLEPKT